MLPAIFLLVYGHTLSANKLDSLTHMALGACLGEITAGKRLGKAALLMGAVAGNLPDLDVLAALWLRPAANLLAHRGFTHSFTGIALVTMLLAFMMNKWHQRNMQYRHWVWFIGSQLLLHIVIDACNAYGTGWWEPFNHTRVSFNLLFVADPLFAIAPFIATLILLVKHGSYLRRKPIAAVALSCCLLYVVQAIVCKAVINTRFNRQLSTIPGNTVQRYFTTPSPFNTWLWYVVAETGSGYYTGYMSVFDGKAGMPLHYFPRNNQLLRGVRDTTELRHLLRFSKGYYTIVPVENYFVFNDLRFGQAGGWYDAAAPFSFHYYIQSPEGNMMVLQRGRFAGWSWPVLRSLWQRIRGT
ncbi:metal-dependent hydrolase [Deminuibacter soli]|uniref:metal-dependent hydrolase n=1 Tax=Deminuibacter soli TaxID=2291815 RepID=UPI001314CBBD|nr:metal-dependent hydrolase [Deminuibacter soli]